MCDVNDPVGLRGRLREPVEILEAAATHLRAKGRETAFSRAC